MELRQLRYFAVICEEGSLTRAGARLHIAQQSLSATVAALETELGVILLDRGPFGVRTTAAGRVLRDKATTLLDDADAAVRAVQRAAEVGSGQVTIRYGLDSEHIIEQLLPRVRARVPQVAITGWTGSDSDNLAALRAGKIDLVLAWAVAGHVGDLQTAAVASEHCWAAVPTSHALAERDAVPVQAVAGLPLVMFPRDAAPWVFDHIISHFTADGRLPPRTRPTSVSGQGGMVDEAAATGALAPVSRSMLSAIDRPDIQFMPFRPELTIPLHLVWRAGLTPAAAHTVAAFKAAATDPRPPAPMHSPVQVETLTFE